MKKKVSNDYDDIIIIKNEDNLKKIIKDFTFTKDYLVLNITGDKYIDTYLKFKLNVNKVFYREIEWVVDSILVTDPIRLETTITFRRVINEESRSTEV